VLIKHSYSYLFFIAAFLSLPCYGDWKSEANARIEQIRKRNVEITVVDSLSNPVPGINVQIEQIGHHFAFGTCISYSPLNSNSNYRNFILDHFEWAVCENETKWTANEPSRDNETYIQADYIYNWCNSNGIKMRGHCLFWEQTSQVQSWVQSLSYATYPTPSDLLTEVDERIDSAVNHYKNKFHNWDVDNEMLNNSFYDRLGEGGRVHMFERAKLRDPSCGMFMNEYNGNSFGGYDSGPYVSRASSLISMGAPIDGLGIQAHLGANLTFDPALYYSNVLQPLATLGLPIWATEFDANHTDETISADNIENFFRICFSHPNVEGIIMWGFWQNSMWRKNAYLVDSSWNLTERGERYEALMDEWTTSDSNTTDTSGNVSFRGFHGTYEITLSYPGQTTEVHTIELEPGETTALFEIETDIEVPEPDTTPPTPNPMTWASYPTATGSSTITMTATTATDTESPPVQYYFECTNDGSKTSGWQSSSTYIASGLIPSTQYSFRVKARDSYTTPNETGWSSTQYATTEPPGTDVEILGSWEEEADLSRAKVAGTNRALIFIAHGERSGTMDLTAVTYGGRSMNEVVDRYYYSGNGAYASAYILNEAGVAAATNNNFVVTWNNTPTEVKYASVFLQNVNQTTLTGATDYGEGTSSTVTTPALATNDGDMVIIAATCGNLGTYTMNNGFTLGVNQSSVSSTGATGYKSATGVAETPSVTHNSVNRQVIIGFVVKGAVVLDEPPAAPTGLAATAGNQTISLDWNDNTEPDLAGYNVYRSMTSGSGYSKLNVSLVSTSDYIDNTVTNGIPYYYVVTAVDSNDHESGYSSEDTATPDYQNCEDVLAGGYGLTSDLMSDCYVNFWDLKIMADYWLNTDCTELDNCEGADFEPTDGTVDLLDFSDFAQQWLLCNNPADSACIENW
jgi:GH35 family endo-1,4-beta-xylanase